MGKTEPDRRVPVHLLMGKAREHGAAPHYLICSGRRVRRSSTWISSARLNFVDKALSSSESHV